MSEGIELDTYRADTADAADTAPGNTSITRMSPITRLIVRDLEKSFAALMGNSNSARNIYSPTPAGSMIEPVGYTHPLV
jgi:hypothetical protein